MYKCYSDLRLKVIFCYHTQGFSLRFCKVILPVRIHLNTFLIRANVRVPSCVKRGAGTEEHHQFFTVLAVVDKKLCSFIVPIAIVS